MSIRSARRLLWPGLLLIACGCGDNPADELLLQLKSPDVAMRRTAARDLGGQPEFDALAIDALAAAVADSDADVRRLSAIALGHAGPAAKSAIPALENALDDSDPRVRWQAAFAVQRIDPQNENFAPVLTGALRSADGKTMLAIGRLGADAAWAVPALISQLAHESPKVRALAARTLGEIGPAATGAKAALQRTGRDANLAVQDAAQAALDKIQADPAVATK